MKIVHLGTRVQAVFGLLDDKGNIIEEYAISPNEGKPLRLLSQKTMSRVLQELEQAWESLQQQKVAAAAPTRENRFPGRDEEEARLDHS